jgi:hypothetical protein
LIHLRLPPSSVHKISLQPGRDSPSLLELFKDEVVEGKVLESHSLDRVLLLLKGKKVNARTHVPLPEGRVLSFKVQEVFPTTILKLIGARFTPSDAVNSSAILAAIEQNVWKTVMENMPQYGLPGEVLALFRRLMVYLSMRVFVTSSPELLKVLIDRSGLRWEAKLRKALRHKGIGRDELNKLAARDLKGLTSKFLGLKPEKGVLLERLVSTIQNIQLLNELGLEQEGKLFLPIPMQFPDGLFTVGQLLVHLPRKERDERKGRKDDKRLFRITFLLELSYLGPLRADLAVRGKDIKGMFLLTREEARLRIERNIPIFISSLKERGFSLHMECHCKDPEIVKKPLITEIIQEEGSTISLVA